jgi:hypothetical protein
LHDLDGFYMQSQLSSEQGGGGRIEDVGFEAGGGDHWPRSRQNAALGPGKEEPPKRAKPGQHLDFTHFN